MEIASNSIKETLNENNLCFQDEGVDINLLDGDDATPLHFAASRGHSDTVNIRLPPRYLFYQYCCFWCYHIPSPIATEMGKFAMYYYEYGFKHSC